MKEDPFIPKDAMISESNEKVINNNVQVENNQQVLNNNVQVENNQQVLNTTNQTNNQIVSNPQPVNVPANNNLEIVEV